MRLFDLHADTLTICEKNGESILSNPYHFDVQRERIYADSSAQILAVYVPDDMPQTETWEYTCRVLQYLESAASPHAPFAIIKSLRDLSNARDTDKTLLFPAVENGRAIGANLSRLALLALRGVAYMTLTWNGQNLLGNGCMAPCTAGLTAFGKAAVEEMYRVHILPDVSHLNEAGFWDVAAIANGRPFIASHSVSKAVKDHPRNITDRQFAAICECGGLVGLNLCADQLGVQTFEQFERHLDHFLSLGGESVLALGMDLDGTELPPSWGGIGVAAQIYGHLLMRGYSQSVLDRLFYKNSMTFFTKTLTSNKECTRIGKVISRRS